MYHLPNRPSTARARFNDAGELLALVADGESPLDFLAVPEGGTPLTREQIDAAVAELDPDALQAVIDAALAEAEAIDPQTATSETVDRINALGDAVEASRARQTAIAEEAEQRQQAAADALARLRGPEGDNDNADGDDAGDAGDDQGDNPPAGDNADTGDREPVGAVTASAPRGRRTTALPRPGGAGGMGTGSAPAAPAAGTGSYTVPRAEVALVAAAGLDGAGLNTGQAIDDRRTLGQAFGHRLEQIRRGRGADGDQVSVVTVQTSYPEDRRLVQNGTDTNTSRIMAATSREALVAAGEYAAGQGALVAAGGLCGPIENLTDVPVLGSSARPVRDALANFGADRGGVRWREHLSFGDFAGAVGIWTLADDAAVTGDPATEPKTKPCLAVECPGEAEAFVEAITLCLEFANVTSRFDPEGTAANIAAAQVAHARIAENRLLGQIAALSTTVTGGEVLGALRDLLTFLDQLIAQYRSFYRLDDAVALHMVLPQWVRNMIRVDLTRGMAGDLDALAVADARIAGWFQARGVNVTYHLDGRTATVPGGPPATDVTMAAQAYGAFTDLGAVAAFPAQIEALLWVEGDMLHLDGGTLDLGVVRDSSLNNVNRYKTFSESWEGVAHRGVESIRAVVTTRPLGMVSGTRDTAAILAA